MLKSLFKKKNSTLADAQEVLNSVDHTLLACAFDVYEHIEKIHPEQYDDFDESVLLKMKNSFEGVKKLVEYKGDFSLFKESENSLLRALLNGYLAYSDIIHVLIDHHDDKEEAEYLFEEHPEIHKKLPKQYDNKRQVLEVLLETVKDFQWQLEHFAMQHYGEIENALGEEHDQDELYVLPD